LNFLPPTAWRSGQANWLSNPRCGGRPLLCGGQPRWVRRGGRPWPSDRAGPWSAVQSWRCGRLPRQERTRFFVDKADGKAVHLTSSFLLALARKVRSSIWLVLKTIHWLLTLGKREVHFSRGGGNFLLFAGVFFTMPKTKKKDKMKKKAEGSSKSLLVEPSSECKEFVVALIARFYERESTMSLESCYI
jgi:hypothetical protein